MNFDKILYGVHLNPFRAENNYGGSRRQPLDLHTLWRLLEQMDKEARRNGIVGNGGGRKTIGLSNIDGDHISENDDIGNTHNEDDNMSEHGKMSTWGNVHFRIILHLLHINYITRFNAIVIMIK